MTRAVDHGKERNAGTTQLQGLRAARGDGEADNDGHAASQYRPGVLTDVMVVLGVKIIGNLISIKFRIRFGSCTYYFLQLHYAFQTPSKLYMVIDLCQGGTL